MRRKDREVTDLSQLEEIIQQCDCIHLGLLDGDYPYVVPMNFGYERTGDQFTFLYARGFGGEEAQPDCGEAQSVLLHGHGPWAGKRGSAVQLVVPL